MVVGRWLDHARAGHVLPLVRLHATRCTSRSSLAPFRSMAAPHKMSGPPRIKRTPNLKRMQLEKERLGWVDIENHRLLHRIEQLKSRTGWAFSKSSAAEHILPLVLERRKRERTREAKMVSKANELMKTRIEQIRHPKKPPGSKKKSWKDGSRSHLRHRQSPSTNKRNALVQNSPSYSGNRTANVRPVWTRVYRAAARLPTNPPGTRTKSHFLITMSRTTYPEETQADKIFAREWSCIRVDAYDTATGTSFRKEVSAGVLQLFFGGVDQYWFPTMFKDQEDHTRLGHVYCDALLAGLKFDQKMLKPSDVKRDTYLNSQLVLLRPHAVLGKRGATAVRLVGMLSGRYQRDLRRKELMEEEEDYTFSPRLRPGVVVSKLSPQKALEKHRVMSARKSVLGCVLKHTSEPAEETMAELPSPNFDTLDAKKIHIMPQPPLRRLRSRQREHRQQRGRDWLAKLKSRVLRPKEHMPTDMPPLTPYAPNRTASSNNNGNDAETNTVEHDVDMSQERDKQAVLKLQALQRGRLARKRSEKEKPVMLERQQSRKATAIQKLVRGVQARERYKEMLESEHIRWRRDYNLRAVFKDTDLNEDGLLQVREFANMLRQVSNIRGGGAGPSPSLLDVKNLMRRINAQYGIGLGEGSAAKQEIDEDCFVAYFMSGLCASPRELAIFARGGQYHEMLANLVVQMREEVERRTMEERMAASYAIFDHYDEDRSGEIDVNEMKQLISDYMGTRGRLYAPSESEVTSLMRSLDQSGDMLLDREEFQRFLMGGLGRTMSERRQYSRRSKMHRKLAMLLDRISLGIDRRTKALHGIFESVDTDGSGFLQATELKQLMHNTCSDSEFLPTDEDVLSFLRAIDENGDMKLSKAEFVLYMLHNDEESESAGENSKIGQWRTKALEKVPW